MKKIYLFLFITILPFAGNSQCSIWSVGNAQTVDKNRMEVSALQTTRFGLTRSIEIGAQPLAMVLLPNVYLKKKWFAEDLIISSRHGVYYPGILLNNIYKNRRQFPGILKNMDRDTIYPIKNSPKGNLTITNELLVSTFLQKASVCARPNLLLTGKLGAHFSFNNDQQILDTIFHPVFHARTQPYNKQLMWYAGAQLDGHFFFEHLDFSVDLQLVSLDMLSDWSIEQKGMLLWTKIPNTRILFGYKMAFANMQNYGNKFMFMPLIDFTYLFGLKTKAEPGDLKGTKRKLPRLPREMKKKKQKKTRK